MAANVGRVEQSSQQDTPFDQDGEIGRDGNLKPDSNLIAAVVQEVMKAFQDKQRGTRTSGKTNGMSNFADDHSRVTWTHLLSNKFQVKGVIERFLAYTENQFNVRVKVIRSDNGTEIVQEDCGSMFAKRGIIHQKTIPGVPQQNGRVERKHRTLGETAKALRLHSVLPKYIFLEIFIVKAI